MTATLAAQPEGGLTRVHEGATLLALAGYGFFAPFSAAGASISGVALVVLALLRPRAILCAQPWREAPLAIGLLLLGWIALHTLVVTGANAAGGSAINKYHELLLMPLLFPLMLAQRHRRVFFHALAAGLFVTAVAYWVVTLQPGVSAKLVFAAQQRRISAGFALALGAYLLLLHAGQAARPWPVRILAFAFGATVLFAIDGRTGHVVLLALAGVAAFQLAPHRLRIGLGLGLPVVLLAVALLGSNAVRHRLSEATNLGQALPTGVNLPSTAIRLELGKLSLDMAARHGLLGAGYANFPRITLEAATRRYTGDPARVSYLHAPWVHAAHPHNEYFMQLLGGGLPALLLYLGWLASIGRTGRRSPGAAGRMLVGSAAAFAMGSLFNSLLHDFVEAHVFSGALAALLAAARVGARAGSPRRILVISTRQIGDVLLTTPLIAAARRRWPQAEVDVTGFAGTLGMLRGNPDVHELIETPPRLGWGGFWRLARRLWRHYDLALVAQPSDRAHLMAWMAARQRSGLLPAHSRSNWWKRLLLDHVVVSGGDDSSQHSVQEKLALLAPWPLAGEPQPVVVPPPASDLPVDVQQALKPGAVVVHVPSMWPYKQWAPEKFAEVVQALLERGYQVALTGSSSARDHACIAPLRGLAPAPALLDLSGRLDFNQLVALLRSAALYIGPDTSVSHLAAATGVPTIAIFGPTNPQRWAPWPAASGEQPVIFHRRGFAQSTGNVTVLQADLPCVPCSRAGCEDHLQSRSDCLIAITPQRVIAAALAVLADTRSGSTGSPPARG